jgi:hypothetical protein
MIIQGAELNQQTLGCRYDIGFVPGCEMLE